MKPKRAGLYVRVSTDEQTVENQELALAAVADRRGWQIVQTYRDEGISGPKSRDKRPGFDAALKDAVRRRFDVLMVWSIDRLGRGTATVVNALAELEAAGVAIYADREAVDGTTPHGRAMLQMAAVFGELERAMIRERINAGLAWARAKGTRLGRRPVRPSVEAKIREHLAAGSGIVKTARMLAVGTGTVHRIAKARMAAAAGAAQ